MLTKNFKLSSKYEPAGDQDKVIQEISKSIQKGNFEQTILGVTGSGKTYMMAKIVEKIQKPTLIIAHNKTLAAQLAEEFKRFFPKNSVHYFVSYYDYYQPESYVPRSDTYIEKQTQINEEIERLRNATTQSLLTRKDVLIVASVSCIYGLGNPADYSSLKIELQIGDKHKLSKLARRLVDMQFTRTNMDLKRSMFAIKGDILEVSPSGEEECYRFFFFGDELEDIEKFDPISQKVIQKVNSYTIFPTTQYITTQEKIKEAIADIEDDLYKRVQELNQKNLLLPAERLKQRTANDIEMLQQLGYVSGIENYSIYFDGRQDGEAPATLIDYFPDDSLIFIDESHITLPQIGAMYSGDRSRKQVLVDYGFRLPSALNNRPLRINEFFEKADQLIYVSATPSAFEIGQTNKIGKSKDAPIIQARESAKTSVCLSQAIIRPTGLLDPEIQVKPVKNQVENVLEEVRQRVKRNQRVLITTLTKKFAEELDFYFKQINIKSAYIHSDVDTLDRLDILADLRRGRYSVLIGINLLREGLDLPEVSLVAIFDADKEGFLRSRTSLIQIVGRAARHEEGKVIMYADNITQSMRYAIEETNRRRQLQIEYNQQHNITPKSVSRVNKTIADEVREEVAKDTDYGQAGAVLTVNGFVKKETSQATQAEPFEIENRFARKNKKSKNPTVSMTRGQQVYDQFEQTKQEIMEELLQKNFSKSELENQLQIAIDSLNFEKAAAIRDLIKK
jgi:excinuclease ABC subunit B